MELPTKKVPSVTQNPRILILYSLPKVGKTTVVSQLDDTLIIDLEKGSRFVDALKVEANSLQEFAQVIAAITKAGKPYKRVVVDTITKLEEMAEDMATAQYKQTPIGKNFTGKTILELPNGAGYLHLRLAYKDLIDRIESLAPEVILLGHLKDKYIGGKEQKAGTEVAVKDLDLTGKIKAIACANADAIGYMYRKDNELRVSFKASNEEITAGARPAHLREYDGPFDWTKIYLGEVLPVAA